MEKYEKERNAPRYKKFESTVKHKPFYMDQEANRFKNHPSPDKYKTEIDWNKIKRSRSEILKPGSHWKKQTYI